MYKSAEDIENGEAIMRHNKAGGGHHRYTVQTVERLDKDKVIVRLTNGESMTVGRLHTFMLG